jgi:hypothetical protein
MKKLGLMLVCALCALAFGVHSASAIPPFSAAFVKKYVDGNDNAAFVEAAKTAKCNVCHVGKDKKEKNAYGKALDELLDKKADAKDEEKINAALDTVAGQKPEGAEKTYGDLIKEGLLPGGTAE